MTGIAGRCRLRIGAIAIAARLVLAVSAAAQSPPADSVIEFVPVPGDTQSSGPQYEYLISRHEIRNDQFVAFLNDALLNLDNERGHYLYFDWDSGDVYIHSGEEGTTGTNGSGTLLLDASANPLVAYDAVLSQYVISPVGGSDGEPGEGHPVTGVTWYGAVKFCNWLTIVTGLAPDERAYNEAPGTNLAGWRPVTTTDEAWAVGDLTDQQREALLSKLGFRLPMDGGSGGDPGPYNEWYKAAAWDPVLSEHHVYGFGRDVIEEGDANFLCSGDPFEDPEDCSDGGTTPVGFFNGVNLLADETATVDTENAYGLYDISGNVWEWMQDQSLSDPGRRRFRGGSWENLDSLLQVVLAFAGQPEDADVNKGFRVVQSLPEGFFVTGYEVRISGRWGGLLDEPHESGTFTFTIHNASTTQMEFEVATGAGWIELTGSSTVLAPAGERVDVDAQVLWDCGSDGLVVGDNMATLTFTRQSDSLEVHRPVTLTVTEPLTTTEGGFNATMLFASDPTPPEAYYTVTNDSETAVQWTAALDIDPPEPVWLIVSLEPDGEIPPLEEGTLTVEMDPPDSPPLSSGTYEATVTVTDVCTGETFEHPVSLVVGEPFAVNHAQGVQSTGLWGGPFVPAEHVFVIDSATDVPVGWFVQIDPEQQDWLELDISGEMQTLEGMDVATVTASLSAGAGDLPPGTHEVTLTFTEESTGFEIERTAVGNILDFVAPIDGVRFTGPTGGPFAPSESCYTLQNIEPFNEIPISVDVSYIDWEGPAWLDVPSDPVLLSDPPDDTVGIPVALLPVAETLEPRDQDYTAQIRFERLDVPGAVSVRTVTLEVGIEAFAVTMAKVPAEHIQPLGPEHLYRVGKYEVTNSQFVRFLNDAYAHQDDPRGQYMDHQTTSGVVVLAGDSTVLFDANAGNAIEFIDGQYVVLDGKEDYPVVGVSWYGALKFCNWMTLIQGMHQDERAYHEGATAGEWYAASTTTSEADLNDAEREVLLGKRGFRLPMDHQADTASLYNEWYKSAAWQDDTGIHTVYGFGRDALEGADANFLCSSDPSENTDDCTDGGPTPVGFFDGVNTLSEGTPTHDTDNGYNLYDMTGNVAEWVQDFGQSSSDRATRGGHFDNTQDSVMLQTDTRVSRPADSALSFVGFRVVQVFEPTGLEVTQEETVRIDGPVGGEYSQEAYVLRIANPSPNHTVDDITITIDVNWLEIDGVPPQQVQPGTYVDVHLTPSTDPTVVGISPAPPGIYALVRGSDAQEFGPVYDYWISRPEVTNDDFAEFLNDARANAIGGTPDERSQYMYFDLNSGSVYINDKQQGEEGADVPADPTLLYDASLGRIHLVDDVYTVDTGFESHPVVGVTWFGAVTYCNWLTVTNGIPADLRAYSEAPSANLDDWRPVTAENWESGSFTNAERAALIGRTIGYRLPMDDEVGAAADYNEWYKAAAWDPVAGENGENHLYAFGRDAIEEKDANHCDSKDTEQDGTTPVAFFNGVNVLFGEQTACPPIAPVVTVTADTDNNYGLYDACGNVAEWMQDFGATALERATRGGSWRDEQTSQLLRNDERGSLPADFTNDETGFRVVRGAGHVATVTVIDHLADTAYERYFILDLRAPFTVEPLTDLEKADTVYGDALSGVYLGAYTVTNQSASQMEWEVSVDTSWVDAVEADSGDTEGTIGGGGAQLMINVGLAESADQLGPGTHVATVTVHNVTTGDSQSRQVTLTISQPIRVEHCGLDPYEFFGYWGGPFEPPQTCTYEFTKDVDFDLQYSVSADQSWVTIEPADALTGDLPTGTSLLFDVAPNEAANDLDVGEHEATLAFAFIDPGNGDLSGAIEQTVKLIVEDLIVIVPAVDEWVVVDPDAQPSQAFTLTNQDAFMPIGVSASVEVDWLDLDIAELEVPPDQGQAQVTVSLNDHVFSLPDGEYFAAVSFDDSLTGHRQCRTVTVSIDENLFIQPFAGFVASGVAGGPISPTFKSYTLTNAGTGGPIDWEVAVQTDDGGDWIEISGAAPTIPLQDGESVIVLVSINASETQSMGEGFHEAVVEFTDLTHNNETFTRTVSLTLVDPKVDVVEAQVSAAAEQPGGPTYAFVMSAFLTTNAQFAAFLNDAVNNLDNECGQYMFFDTSTGEVYVNYTITGQVGDAPGPRSTKMFAPGISQQILYNWGEEPYQIVTDPIDYSQHPVTGVTWYGALKYCNWLTLDQGMLPGERCYTEATDANDALGWHPVTISTSDWESRDLTDAERLELVTDHRGYRLPMDDGSNNPQPTTDLPDAYNEWYKAAAWNDTLQQNTIYGFGRDTVTGADANFADSGDPFDNGTTPVGFFDGTVYNADGSLDEDQVPDEGDFQTTTDGNGFGLFDMTGNVHQWMQGYFAPPGVIDRRTLRGGSWNDPIDAASLQTSARPLFYGPDGTHNEVGFRVVRTLATPTGDYDRDGDVDEDDFAEFAGHLSGPGGGVLPEWTVFDFDTDGDIDLSDFAAFQTLFNEPP